MKKLLDYVGYIVFALCWIVINSVWVWAQGYEYLFKLLIWFFAPLVVFVGAYGLFFRLRKLKSKSLELRDLMFFYLEYIFMFAGLYALSSVLSGGEAIENHAHIANEILDKSSFVYLEFFKAQVLVFIDAFYFSVSTATTVGFGDIHPVHPVVKIFVIMQVLSCLVIAVVGAGYYFNSSGDKQKHPSNVDLK